MHACIHWRCMHAYTQVRASVKAENPEAGTGALSILMGAQWKAMDEEAKAPYTKLAEEQKVAY